MKENRSCKINCNSLNFDKIIMLDSQNYENLF